MSETTDLLAKVPLLSTPRSETAGTAGTRFQRADVPGRERRRSRGRHPRDGLLRRRGRRGHRDVGGKEVGKIGRGSYFGEVALISDRSRTATVTATTDLRTLVMTFWDFRAFVKSDADVAWKLLEHVGGMLHGRG